MNGRNIAAVSALTPNQEGILLHVIRDGARGAYHSQFSARIDADLDSARWHKAWQQVVARHEALRALITWEGRDKPLQIIRQHVDLPWQTLDWSAQTGQQQDSALTEWLKRDRDLGFTLERAPLLRCALIRLGPERFRFVLSFHHLIMDGWSMRLAFDEARVLYDNPAALPARAPGITRYAEWLARRDTAGDAAFWRDYLGDFDAPVFPDIAQQTNSTDTHALVRTTLGADEHDALAALARDLRVTMSSVLSAAHALLLRLYCDRDDLVFGTTVAGRPPELPDAERTVGLFINTLPLRVRVDGAATLADFVRGVHEQQIALRAREQSSAALAQANSGVASGTALFESLLVYENFPAGDHPEHGPPCTIDRFVEFSHFPLAVLAVPGDAFELIAIADPARIDPPALTDLVANLTHILRALPAQRDRRVDALDALSPEQRNTVVTRFNQTAVSPPPADTAYAQCLEHARATPEHIALTDAQRRVTYRELAQQAAATAAQLQTAGVQRDDVVLVAGPRDAVTVCGIFGVLGAGAAFCPVAQDSTPERLSTLVGELERDGRRVVALVAPAAHGALPDGVTPVTLTWHDETADAWPDGPAPDDTAYVMFTSGSTGTPKGVVVTHSNLAHSLHARDRYYRDAPGAFGLLSTLPTDSAMAGLFWTLCRGGTLVLPRDRAEQDIAGLATTLAHNSVTHLLTVPSLYALLLDEIDAGHTLATAIVAGEACPPALVDAHHARLPGVELHNEYGPTEATVWCSAAPLLPGAPVRIGKPLANTRLYVVNRRGQPLPVGVAGELYIGGAHVAARYAGDPQRTAERFVADAFTSTAPIDWPRVYRSGDRVRWHADGSLSFVGRVDDQIKVRGFRVEPGEIEAALCAHPAIDEAVVALHADGAGPGRLVAWLRSTDAPDLSELRASLAGRLPAHMVPQHYEVLSELPRTRAGKVDRRALGSRALSLPAPTTTHAPPQDDAQAALAAIWCEVLGVPSVGIHDDFFALGGDSLLSIRVLARAGKAGLALAPADFFAHPTVAGQAAAAAHGPQRRVAQKPVVGPQPLMPIQRWFFSAITRGTAHWNLSYRFDLNVSTTLAQLRRAVNAVVAHHDALRSAFTEADGQWHVRVLPPSDVDVVDELDLRGVANPAAALVAHADAMNRALVLDRPPLLRVTLVRTPQGAPDALILAAHHLVMDAESWRILIEDLGAVVGQLERDEAPALPPRTDALQTFARRLAEWPDSDDFAARAAAWQASLAGPYTDLEADATPAHSDEGHVQTLDVRLATASTAALPASAGQHRATVYELLVAGVARALGQHTGAEAVRFELEGHGRDPVFAELDVSRTVGWFTAAYPVVVREPGRFASAADALRAVKRDLRALPDSGLSYGALVASDLPAGDALRAAGRAAVLFNFLGEQDQRGDGPLVLADTRCGQARSDDAPRPYLLEINARIVDKQLVMTLAWPSTAFSAARVQGLADQLLATLRALGDSDDSTAVPEDFPLASLSSDDLSDLSDLLDELDDDSD